MTEDQWSAIEAQLSRPYGSVKLCCDGYEIQAVVARLKGSELCIVIYVNGCLREEWLDERDELGLKFYCKKRHYVYPVKLRAKAKQKLKDGQLDKFFRELYQHTFNAGFDVWRPCWSSSRAFCRHIRKSCSEIELL